MKIEVLSIGNEILSGIIINSNAAYISQILFQEGFSVSRHTVLPDDPHILRQGIEDALSRTDLLLTTGGLGPTCDDITRKVVADIFQSDFHYDAEIAADLTRRYGNFPTIPDQATVPSKATILKNKLGTAPGLVFKAEKSTLIMMPGVPPEMKEMLNDEVLPYIKRTFQLKKRPYFKRLNFFGLPEAAIDPLLRKLKEQYPLVDFGIYPSLGIVNVQITTISTDETSAMNQLDSCYHAIANEFAANLFLSSTGRIEEAVHDRFIKNKWTLSIAESCTGGSLAAHLIQLPGASQYFLGSIVAYSNELKTEFLDVSENLIMEKGAVSKEVVAEMLQGLFKRTKCDFGIAVTGIAGPTGGTPEKPIGTVWGAVGHRGDDPHVWKLHVRGPREMIIEWSVNALLANLLKISQQAKFFNL